jgi:hypothetical protein
MLPYLRALRSGSRFERIARPTPVHLTNVKHNVIIFMFGLQSHLCSGVLRMMFGMFVILGFDADSSSYRARPKRKWKHK